MFYPQLNERTQSLPSCLTVAEWMELYKQNNVLPGGQRPGGPERWWWLPLQFIGVHHYCPVTLWTELQEERSAINLQEGGGRCYCLSSRAQTCWGHPVRPLLFLSPADDEEDEEEDDVVLGISICTHMIFVIWWVVHMHIMIKDSSAGEIYTQSFKASIQHENNWIFRIYWLLFPVDEREIICNVYVCSWAQFICMFVQQ